MARPKSESGLTRSSEPLGYVRVKRGIRDRFKLRATEKDIRSSQVEEQTLASRGVTLREDRSADSIHVPIPAERHHVSTQEFSSSGYPDLHEFVRGKGFRVFQELVLAHCRCPVPKVPIFEPIDVAPAQAAEQVGRPNCYV